MLTAALLAATAFTACSWDHPGADRFTGDTAAFIMSKYTDIPLPERAQLAAMADKHQYTDRVRITRTEITGSFEYAPTISMMGFSYGRVCQRVTRDGLPEDQEALVYTVGAYSIGVAAVCGNPFRLSVIPTSILPPATPGEATPVPVAYFEPVAPFEVVPGTVAPPVQFAPVYGGSSSFYGGSGGGVVFFPGAPGAPGGNTPPPVSAVPEASTWCFLGFGLVLMMLLFRRRD